MELHPHRIHFRSLIVTFFLGICVIVIGVVYRYQENGYFVPSTKSNTSTTKAPDAVKPTAIVEKSEAESQTTVVKNSAQAVEIGDRFVIKASRQAKAGELFTFTLVGSSEGKKPIGYDALIAIEGGTYDVVSVKSLTSEFNVLKFVKPGRITVTGALATKVKEASVWSSQEIASITIKPKQAGQYKLSVLESAGRESSKIMVKDDNDQSLKFTSNSSEAVLVDITN